MRLGLSWVSWDKKFLIILLKIVSKSLFEYPLLTSICLTCFNSSCRDCQEAHTLIALRTYALITLLLYCSGHSPAPFKHLSILVGFRYTDVVNFSNLEKFTTSREIKGECEKTSSGWWYIRERQRAVWNYEWEITVCICLGWWRGDS